MADSSEKKLNPEQIEAIEYGDGPLLIIAGAGTGKTTVITERVRHLIVEKGIPPEQVLALTFTEKAAREMEERIDRALPLGYAHLWISTFHSFCDRILRDEAINVGLDPGYRLMTQAENIQFLRDNLFQLDLEYFRPLGNPYKFVEGLLGHFSRLKDEDVPPQEYLNWAKKKVGEAGAEEEKEEAEKFLEAAGAYNAYEALKVKEGAMDFGDLLSQVLSVFRSRKNILKKYQQKFKAVLVDEFQDTNYAQYVLIKLLAPPPKPNLTVCGDDSQSIYKFRGAAISNIIQFMDDYPAAKEVVLTKNYRSTQTILNASHKLIKNNDPDTLEAKLGICKKLQKMTAAPEVPIDFIRAERMEEEAELVALKIKELADGSGSEGEGYSWQDFAILVRANAHAEPFIKALNWQGIPNQFLGPGLLLRQPEVKDLIAFLRVIYDFSDSVSFYRLLAMDFFNLHGRDLSALLNWARKQRVSLFEVCEELAIEAKEDESKGEDGKSKEPPMVSPSAQETIARLVKIIHRHLDLAKKKTAGELLYSFLDETGLLRELASYKTAEDEKRAQNITKFFEKLKGYEADHEDASVYALVDYINLSLELGESPLANDTDWMENEAVNILTVHSAKGLEFPVVFLVNLVSRRFPTIQRREQIPIPEELIKETLPEGDYHLQEERRLFYVGMTRARERLFLTAANYYGEGKREKKISPFVTEALGEKALDQSLKATAKNTQLDIFTPPSPPSVVAQVGSRQPVNYLSYSQIETFKLCPLKYRFRYILGLPSPPAAATSFGSSIHQTLQVFYQQAMAGLKPGKERLLKIFEDNWQPFGYSSKAQKERYHREGIKILGQFYEQGFNPHLLPIALEQSFSIKVGRGLRAGGKIDRVDRFGEGVEIIDYKTGKLMSKKDADKDLQLTLYALAATEGCLGQIENLRKPPQPEQVKVSFYFFDGQTKVSSQRTKEELEQVKEEIFNLAAEIEKTDFQPSPGKLCDFCEYRMLCDAWK